LVVVTASAFAFSTAGFFTRLITLDVWTVLFWRAVFGGLALGSYVIWQHRRQTVTAFWAMGRAGIAVALCAALATICFINALSQTTVADVLVINATAPLMTAALAWHWTSERESKATIIASVAAFFGVTVMVSAALTEGHILGDLLAVIMTVLYSATMIIIRTNREISMVPAACLSAFLCSLIVLPISVPSAARGMTILYLMLFGTIQFGLGALLVTIGTRMISATRSALIGSLETPLAPVWVWLAFGEVLSPSTIVGGLIVMMAVVGEVLTKSVAGKTQPARSFLDEDGSG
jgi:drug/metabolite transporter (DMT)-like permease